MSEVVLFGPTLRSRGGLAALDQQYAGLRGLIQAAILHEDLRRSDLPTVMRGASVQYVSGHRAGSSAIRGVLRQYPAAQVIALQNPVLPVVQFEETFIQNHLAAHPWRAARTSRSPRWWAYIGKLWLLTALQILRSRRLLVLNSDIPWWWRRVSDVRVRGNALAPGHLAVAPMSQRQKVVVVITTWEPFRGAHVVLEAFQRSKIRHQGWRLEVHAPHSGQPYESWCKREWKSGGVEFVDDSVRTQEALASARVAAFPSRVEGSSIAFLEALCLGEEVIALDAVHYREAALAAPAAEGRRVTWVRRDSVDAWVSAMRSVAL